MLRKLLMTSVASLGLLSSLAVAPAQAHEFHHEGRSEWRHDYRCHVYYRESCHRGWVCAGNFCNRREAERCAERYRCRGFEIRIR
jgi:hypothetical protein